MAAGRRGLYVVFPNHGVRAGPPRREGTGHQSTIVASPNLSEEGAILISGNNIRCQPKTPLPAGAPNMHKERKLHQDRGRAERSGRPDSSNTAVFILGLQFSTQPSFVVLTRLSLESARLRGPMGMVESKQNQDSATRKRKNFTTWRQSYLEWRFRAITASTVPLRSADSSIIQAYTRTVINPFKI